mmetsp:Transcript_60850/g.145028  ORF Transcript_60850/g.145028 Transcript_60850/m.145028 type:complete len:262 (-) Transcript_60850:1593-2378(-)
MASLLMRPTSLSVDTARDVPSEGGTAGEIMRWSIGCGRSGVANDECHDCRMECEVCPRLDCPCMVMSSTSFPNACWMMSASSRRRMAISRALAGPRNLRKAFSISSLFNKRSPSTSRTSKSKEASEGCTSNDLRYVCIASLRRFCKNSSLVTTPPPPSWSSSSSLPKCLNNSRMLCANVSSLSSRTLLVTSATNRPVTKFIMAKSDTAMYNTNNTPMMGDTSLIKGETIESQLTPLKTHSNIVSMDRPNEPNQYCKCSSCM